VSAIKLLIFFLITAVSSLACQFDTNGKHDAAAQAKYDAWIQSQNSDVQRQVVGKVLTAADNTEFWKKPQAQQPPAQQEYRRPIAEPQQQQQNRQQDSQSTPEYRRSGGQEFERGN